MSDDLEATVDKFTFKVPTDRLYSREGLWVLVDQTGGTDRVRLGLTDYVQQHSGDATIVTVKPAGTQLKVGDALADFETLKASVVLSSPVSGTISTVNGALELNPELVNQSPYEKGWLVEIDATNWNGERGGLLDADVYFAGMKAEAEEEATRL